MANKEKTAAPEKEHKKNWREVEASVDDIERYLSDHVQLRKNVINGRVECHLLNCSPWESYDGSEESAMALLMAMTEQQQPGDETPILWRSIDDRIVNTLWRALSKQKHVNIKNIYLLLDSDFVPEFNPFRHYLNRLPPWDEDTNPIFDLAMTVTVKGGPDEQLLFYVCLRKWLVAMVAGWLEDHVVNQEILVLVGRQGIYKTTWFSHLLPPELQTYFHSNTSFGNMTKDEVLKLSRYGLICCEELDTMRPQEMNRLKWAVTTTVTDERKPYAHSPERRNHIASYCGTGNNIQFIDDDTGTRRWLPFEVESIRSPYEFPIDHTAIFAQAYALYRKGFRYWFNDQEMQLMARHNERFEVPKPEHELISRFYRPPKEGERGEFVSSTEIMQTVGGLLVYRLTMNKLGRAMTALGFVGVRSHGQRGYLVVAYPPEEIKANKSVLAYEAKPESEALTVSAKEIFDTNDTIF